MKKIVMSGALALLTAIQIAQAEEIELVKGKQVTVTRSQFDQALQRMSEADRNQFLSKESRVFKAVQNYYITQVAIHNAKQEGIYDSPRMQALIEKAVGDTVLQEMYRLYKEKQPPVDLEELARDYYKANLAKYLRPEKVSAAHILIDTKSRSQEEAKELAEKVRQEALAGKDFGKLADEYSDDPSASANHGQLGFFDKRTMVEPFAEAAFALKNEGDISPVVETKFGFHIIKLEGRKAAEPVEFERVKPEILKTIEREQEERYRVKFKNELTDIDNVVINNEAIKDMVTK